MSISQAEPTAATTDAGRRATLSDRVVGGVAWNILTQITIQSSRIAVGIVLAHLLSPHQFGIAGMAFVFSNFLIIFSDPSLGAALIQRPEITEEDRSTIFWTMLGTGLLCTGLGVAASGLIADFFHQPEVGPLFALLSVSFTFASLAGTQTALLTRQFAYRRLQLRDMGAVLIGAVVGVVSAAAGLGPWAIILQTVTFWGASAALIWTLTPWRPHFTFSAASLRTLGGFGFKLLGSRILSYANLNMDNLLVGRYLGSGALGNYSLAYNVMFTPVTRLIQPFQQVVYPAYSRLQSDRARLARAWVRSKRMTAALLAPIFLAILITAPDLVPVVFGKKWHSAVPVMQLLCAAGVAHCLVTLNWSVLQAVGQAGVLFRLNLLYGIVIIGAFVLGLQWGIVGVAACYAIARWALVIPDTWITLRPLPMGVVEALRGSGTAIPLAAVSAGSAYLFRLALVSAGVPALARLVLVLVAGGVLYAILILLVAPDLMREIRGLRGSLARARATGN